MKPFVIYSLGFLGIALVVAVAWLYTPDKKQADLEATYTNAASTFLNVAGVRLHMRDTGPRDAEALILLHGFGSSLHTWEPWAETLSEDYRVIRFDLPGFALTGSDPTNDYSDARGIEILTALMDQLGLADATIIGNSIGGRLAWMFAVAQPDRVAKLVLISPDGFASPGFEYGKQAEVPASINLMRYFLPAPLVKMSLAPAYADPSRMTDEMVTRYHDLMLGPDVRSAMIARLEQVRLQDPEPLLTKIEAPTLLMWGVKDAMIPVSNAEDYTRLLPNSTLVTFPNLGHVPHEESPGESLAALQKFLALHPHK